MVPLPTPWNPLTGSTIDSLNSWEMIYVGDEVRDVKAAQKAGVPMAGVTWGFNSREALGKLSPEWLLSDPAGLRELVEEIRQPPRRAI